MESDIDHLKQILVLINNPNYNRKAMQEHMRKAIVLLLKKAIEK